MGAPDNREMKDRLWKEIDDVRAGMLGLVGADMHYQPMTAFAEKDAGRIWFFTKTDTDLAKAVGDGAKAMFIVMSKDQDVQACVGGDLMIQHDRARIDKYWNPVVAAWYPDGKDDPKLTLLCLECEDAAIWVSKGGPVRFGWEIAKANAAKTQPDLGDQAKIDLH